MPSLPEPQPQAPPDYLSLQLSAYPQPHPASVSARRPPLFRTPLAPPAPPSPNLARPLQRIPERSFCSPIAPDLPADFHGFSSRDQARKPFNHSDISRFSP